MMDDFAGLLVVFALCAVLLYVAFTVFWVGVTLVALGLLILAPWFVPAFVRTVRKRKAEDSNPRV